MFNPKYVGSVQRAELNEEKEFIKHIRACANNNQVEVAIGHIIEYKKYPTNEFIKSVILYNSLVSPMQKINASKARELKNRIMNNQSSLDNNDAFIYG